MPSRFPDPGIPDSSVPQAASPLFQHLLDTYASETNKVISVWRALHADDMDLKPHPRSATVREILKHQLLSERRFFGEFLGTPELPTARILPETDSPEAFTRRLTELALPRLGFLAGMQEPWWFEPVPFFEVVRQRIWIFWRRLLHTAHHRTQLTVYFRLMGKPVPPTYGPTADVSWNGADPTQTTDAAGRR